jgi:hypothetical protein
VALSEINEGHPLTHIITARMGPIMFANSVRLFSVYKFDIRVDPSWLIIAALVTWSLSQQFFPDALPGRSSSSYLVMAIVAMLGLFASLVLHELAIQSSPVIWLCRSNQSPCSCSAVLRSLKLNQNQG